ncbi:response regulator transcription factor [Nesterenkonia pannonica]|uniref:response regulator n=1 Tax=Nesterenkonia pannonica TaxID=1548602 RepID=UPI00216417A7|nr:response regulator transcription factor [Nesterenkonia pannonica]
MIRVFLVEDQPMMQEALRLYLDSTDDLVLAGEAADGVDAVEMVRESAPDVVVMDVDLPGQNGVAATREILEESPDIRVLVVTTFTTDHHVVRALRAGARGYVTKDAHASTVLDAIRSVAAGSTRSPRPAPVRPRRLMTRLLQISPRRLPIRLVCPTFRLES